MNRTELIEAGARNTTVSADDVARIIEDVEPLVRADERERQEEGWAARLNSTVAWAENGVRADLYAKVEALHAKAEVVGLSERAFAYEVVLKLIDGGSNE